MPGQILDPFGLLVIAGTEPNAVADFIKNADLIDQEGGMRRPDAPPTFIGENALLKSMTYLVEGKVRSHVYFTQGNGECDVKDSAGPNGIGKIFSRLGEGNYEPHALSWKPGMKRFTDDAEFKKDDADLLVMVRPTPAGPRFSDDFLDAVRAFLNGEGGRKKGKLLLLLDVSREEGQQMKVTGLEALLTPFGVKVNNDHVVAINGVKRDPLAVIVLTNFESTNPIAKAFMNPNSGKVTPFLFRDTRTVVPLPEGNPGAVQSGNASFGTRGTTDLG